jgi:PhzF family phenazine biosynthesis protein
MKIPVYQVDAFAEKIFTGNPAAVCPLNEWLSDELMQQVAMENNLAETAYFVGENGNYHIRWFTPELEIDLCGHATLASAYTIFEILGYKGNEISFTTEKAGILKVYKQNDLIVLDFPSRPPQPTGIPQELFSALGIDGAVEVLKSRDYFVVVEHEEIVRGLQPDFNLLNKIQDTKGCIVTAKGNEYDFVSRFFAPQAGINEDPVTGSAHCNLIPYWANKLGKNKLAAFQASKRGGVLYCELKDDRVLMGGRAVCFLQGEILI